MTSRLQMTLVIAKSHSEKITFAALMTEQMQHEKRASDDEKKYSRKYNRKQLEASNIHKKPHFLPKPLPFD